MAAYSAAGLGRLIPKAQKAPIVRCWRYFYGMKEASMSEQFLAASAACLKIKFSDDEASPTSGARCVRFEDCRKFESPVLESVCNLREAE